MSEEQFLVFSDLDGTLLDHHDYSYSAASSSLQFLKKQGIPLIFNTSKTFEEVRSFREELECWHPFIVENGGAVCIPKGYFEGKSVENIHDFEIQHFGPSYDEILSILKKIRLDHNFSFQGFSDWSSEELSDITNLPLEKAKKAKARICSEPILWDDSEESFSKFKEIIQGHNLGLIQGGRFIHVTGQTNKGKGVLWLKQQYQNYNPEDNLTTIGLGDCPNDIAMLEVVDMPVVIDSVKREPLKLGSSYPNTIYTNRQGSVGWQYAMKKIFDL